MNNKTTVIIFVIVFLLGIALINYPFIAKLINERTQSEIAADYNDKTKSLSQKEIDEAILEARNYNESLANGVKSQKITESFDALPGEDSYYMSLLRVKDTDVMATVIIPRVKVNLPIYHGTSQHSLDNGAGHVEGTSLPIGGESTHTCLSAHRGLPTKRMFTDIDVLRKGDKFYIHVYKEILAYEVFKVQIVKPQDTDPLKIQPGEDLATLITCHPFGVNSHRIYVHGQRVPYHIGDEKTPFEMLVFFKIYWRLILTVLMLALMIYLLLRKKKKSDSDEEA